MIGIVGGMGPEAGHDLLLQIHALTEAKRDQDHLPVCLLSVPHIIPDRSDFLLGRSNTNPAAQINTIIQSLISIGAKVIGIPCNSAHAPEIFQKLNVPSNIKLIHMIEEVVKSVIQKAPNESKVGILCTSGTIQSRTYDVIFKQHGITVEHLPEDLQQESIQKAIYEIKAGVHKNSALPKHRLEQGIDYFSQRGIHTIILGCTEIALIDFGLENKQMTFINSTTVLADALIKKARENPGPYAEKITD